jgi:hypothetical protein
MSHMFSVLGLAIESSRRVVKGLMSWAALNWLPGVFEVGDKIDAEAFLWCAFA